MALAPERVAQFQEQGWLDLGPIFSAAEVERFREAYDGCLAALENSAAAAAAAGADTAADADAAAAGSDASPAAPALPDLSRPPRPGQRVHQIRAAHLQHALFAELIRDPRITDAVASLVSDDLKIILCQGLYKPPLIGGELDWHQDDAYFETESASHKVAPLVSCWVTFDDATVNSSCMWVLPGSHSNGVLQHTQTTGLSLLDLDDSQARPVELKAGSAMLHHGAMPHRTLPNTSPFPRRAVAIHFVPADATSRSDFRNREPEENTPVVRRGCAARL